MPLYMLHRSMLLGKLLALYLPLFAGAYFNKLQDQRLDQLEPQKAMAIELKWVLSRVLDQLAILPMLMR